MQMVKREIVFLGGIHGTGKGTVSQVLCAKHKLKYLSASELIKWKEINHDISNKTINNVTETQKRLISRLSEVCVPEKKYLLDGHFCLLNSELKPIRVDLEIFKEINPCMLLIMIVEPKIIKERLMTRDQKDYDLETLINMQNEEEKYANEIAVKLNIPLHCIYDSNILEVSETLKQSL